MDVVITLNEKDKQKAWRLLEARNRDSHRPQTMQEYLEHLLAGAIGREHQEYETHIRFWENRGGERE